MKIRSIKQLKNLKNKRVLLRVDFNVPIKNNKVADNKRILVSMPTIEYLLKQKAKVIIVTHLGRPEGYNGKAKSGYDKKFDLSPVVKKISELLKKKIIFVGDKKIGRPEDQKIYFDSAKKIIDKMKAGEIVMLENMRFFPEEAKDITELSKKLASLGDIYVLDGFAVAHRAAASVSGVAKYLPSYAGLLLEKEITGLSKAMDKPKKPFVLILGGVKMETKIPVIKNLLPKCNYALIGAGIINTYLWAKGYKVGDSVVDKDFKKEILKYCNSKKVIKPVDVVVGTMDGKTYRHVMINKKPNQICKTGESILDCGPGTIQLYAKYIKKAETLVWNGPMGLFQTKPYEIGSFSIARLVASRAKGKAFGVIGGGETLQAMELVGMTEYVDLVSTGGGAMLEFLSGKKLPGVVAVSVGKK
ncbi:MAG TPA: phosphoglycerate kinase [Candidatus Magasanikbacteria bacterium]|nr:phosphoglycerate kinase [Candidatus Magasanikbacteria bacterium]